jgi:hypothetical protein
MSEQSEENGSNRSKPLMIGISIAVIALVVAAAFALMNRDTKGPIDAGPDASPSPTQPPLKQARWQIEAKVVPAGGKHKSKLLKLQAAAVGTVVKEFYDAFLINPGDFDSLVNKDISAEAAKVLAASKIDSGKTIERLQTLRRSAKIGLQAPTAMHASARVGIKLRGKVGSKKVMLSHQSTLWLERKGSRWQVIGFEADQRPIK